MAPTRPSPATDLLWAHQLKREHGFLLDRMDKMAAELARVDGSAKAAEAAASDHDIASIVKQVQSLIDNSANDTLRQEVRAKLEGVRGDIEAVTVKVSTMARVDEKLAEERREAFQAQKALVKRIKEMGETLDQNSSKMTALEDRVDEGTLEVICKKLGRMEEEIIKERADGDAAKESVRSLSQVVEELKARTEDLAEQVELVASSPVSQPNVLAAQPESVVHAAQASSGSKNTVSNQQQPNSVAPARRGRAKPERTSKDTTESTAEHRGRKPEVLVSDARGSRRSHAAAVEDAAPQQEMPPPRRRIKQPEELQASELKSRSLKRHFTQEIASQLAGDLLDMPERTTRSQAHALFGLAEAEHPIKKEPTVRALGHKKKQPMRHSMKNDVFHRIPDLPSTALGGNEETHLRGAEEHPLPQKRRIIQQYDMNGSESRLK